MLWYMEPIVDTHHYKSSRIIRSDLFHRFLATFSLFYWMLDYLTLGLSSILLNLTSFPILGSLLAPVLSLASTLVNLAKALVSAAITVALSPILLTVHAIVGLVKSNLMEKIGQLKVIIDPQDFPLGRNLKDTSLDYSPDLMLRPMEQHRTTGELNFCTDVPNSYRRSSPSIIHYAICRVSGYNHDSMIPSTNITEIKAKIVNTHENKEAMEAMLGMNMFWSTSRLEKMGLLEAVERQFNIRR